jgi:hypothetical protein
MPLSWFCGGMQNAHEQVSELKGVVEGHNISGNKDPVLLYN